MTRGFINPERIELKLAPCVNMGFKITLKNQKTLIINGLQSCHR